MTETVKKELAISILDLFENFLERKGVDIPNVDRDEYEEESQMEAAILFGSDYYGLEDGVMNILSTVED